MVNITSRSSDIISFNFIRLDFVPIDIKIKFSDFDNPAIFIASLI